MTREQAKKAVEALRSGKFAQKRCGLTNRQRTEFCCIGVAALANGFQLYDTHAAVEDLQLTQHQMHTLINMNDCKKLDFNRIADWIEHYPNWS